MFSSQSTTPATASLQQAIGQAATVTMFDVIRGRIYWLTSVVQDTFNRFLNMLHYFYQNYPPIAGFMATLVALSAIPLGIFTTYASISTAIFFGIAAVLFILVNGFWVGLGGGVLFLVLGVIGMFTSFVFFWITLAWLGYRATGLAASKAIQVATG